MNDCLTSRPVIILSELIHLIIVLIFLFLSCVFQLSFPPFDLLSPASDEYLKVKYSFEMKGWCVCLVSLSACLFFICLLSYIREPCKHYNWKNIFVAIFGIGVNIFAMLISTAFFELGVSKRGARFKDYYPVEVQGWLQVVPMLVTMVVLLVVSCVSMKVWWRVVVVVGVFLSTHVLLHVLWRPFILDWITHAR